MRFKDTTHRIRKYLLVIANISYLLGGDWWLCEP